MPLVRTNCVLTIVACAQVWDNQRPWPTKYATYRPLVHAEREILKLKGLAMIRGACGDKDHLISGRYCVSVVMTSSPSNGDPWFWTWWGNDDHPRTHMGICFVAYLVELLICGANQGEAKWRRNQPFPPAKTTSFHRPNRCAPKISKTIQ